MNGSSCSNEISWDMCRNTSNVHVFSVRVTRHATNVCRWYWSSSMCDSPFVYLLVASLISYLGRRSLSSQCCLTSIWLTPSRISYLGKCSLSSQCLTSAWLTPSRISYLGKCSLSSQCCLTSISLTPSRISYLGKCSLSSQCYLTSVWLTPSKVVSPRTLFGIGAEL
jgi:hypothetical protein